jgi:hypothetical protein
MANKYLCVDCLYERVPINRAKWCIKEQQRITCLQCGEVRAKQVKHTVAPINKSNYYYISNKETLKQLNPKRTV